MVSKSNCGGADIGRSLWNSASDDHTKCRMSRKKSDIDDWLEKASKQAVERRISNAGCRISHSPKDGNCFKLLITGLGLMNTLSCII
jgi:hypothetical protein